VVADSQDGTRILVPVGESVTLRNTVAYVVRELDGVAESGGRPTIHFVYPVAWQGTEETASEQFAEAHDLLDRVAVWAETDLGETDDPDETVGASIETAIIGTEDFLFSPSDYAEVIVEYAREHDLSRVVIDPEYDPGGTTPLIQPLAAAIEALGLDVEEAPVERQARRAVLAGRGVSQFVVVFGIVYGFYMLLAGGLHLVDLITGAITATVVSLTLAQVVFRNPPPIRRGIRAVAMFLVYGPYLLWEIAKANVHIARVVLSPSLPIDPQLVSFDGAVWGDLPVTTLANSITLTPGTLTVDVTQREFRIHTLTESSREDLLAGGLERAVRFVFYGRATARIPSPKERDRDRGEES